MLKNKKGLGLGIDDWGSWLVFPLIIIIFFLLFKSTLFLSKIDFTGTAKIGQGTKYDILGISETPDLNILFLNILKTPITINIEDKEEQLAFADLIIKYYLGQDTPKAGDLQKLLIQKTNEFFDKKYPNLAWKLIVTDKKLSEFGGAITVASGQSTEKITEDKTLVGSLGIFCTYLPNPELENPIKVELVLFNLASDAFVLDQYQSLKSIEFHC